jgi:hypothetical protein
MKRLILILALAVAAWGQPTPDSIRVVEVKQGDPEAITRSITGFIRASVSGRMIILSGQPAVLDAFEAAIKKMDVPPPAVPPDPNVELTIHVLRGSATEATGSALPADLDSTIRQLRSLFPYKSYSLMDTQILRVRSARSAEASANVSGYNFTYKVQPTVNPGKAPRSIHLARFEAGFRSPMVVDGKTQYQYNGIITEIDAMEGQKTVVGKSNLGPDAVIVVVTPRVIE